VERQVTQLSCGHILTNANVWSPDGRRIVYDVRSDAAGEKFDSSRIESVDVETGEICVLYESTRGAHCGVATYHPILDRVAFILGPEDPTPHFSYGPARRRGVMVDEISPGVAIDLDARDLVPPFTSGALRGGSHVHLFSADGSRVGFTYEDHILPTGKGELNQRNVGVSVLDSPVIVARHPRNHHGSAFSALVTRTTDRPRVGSDEISKAFEDAWVGTNGYLRVDGSRQRWAIAFQGLVAAAHNTTVAEVCIVDLPEDLTQPSEGPLQGTLTTRPRPPLGCVQRRLSFTEGRRFPGIQGPRHWLRSSPDGSAIAFLMRDDNGIVQLWTVSPNGGLFTQLTLSRESISSAFTWSPDGTRLACVIGQCVCIVEAISGSITPLTKPCSEEEAPRPEACVFSQDGLRIAYVRRVCLQNQIFVCDVRS